MTDWDFTGLRATFVNCTLKKSPEMSHTQGLVDASAAIMGEHGVDVDVIRLIDHDIATGVYPDMREHGWDSDEWPELYPGILDSQILVVAGPIWLGDNSSVTKRFIERIYSLSGLLNDKGQYLFYGRVAGCLITGNEDGIKHCAQNILYSLQHVGYTIPPNADAGWIGEAGPGPSYLDPGSGGPENDFTNRNTTFMTWNLMHLAKLLHDCRRCAGAGQPTLRLERGRALRLAQPRVPLSRLTPAEGRGPSRWAESLGRVTGPSHPVRMMRTPLGHRDSGQTGLPRPSPVCPPRKVVLPCRSGKSCGSSSSSSPSWPTSWSSSTSSVTSSETTPCRAGSRRCGSSR